MRGSNIIKKLHVHLKIYPYYYLTIYYLVNPDIVWVYKIPLIEITVAKDSLNEEERLRMAKAIQKTMIKEFEEMKGRTPGSYVIVRVVANETWLSTRPNS